MSSIAIFPCSHTSATTIIDDLARQLELQVYDDQQLISDASKAHGVSVDKLRSAVFGKTSVFNQFTLEREKSVNLLKATLQQKLDSETSYLLHGFLTLLVPARITHVLKVLAVDTKHDRIEYAKAHGLTEKEAKRAIKNDDVTAYGWSDFLYKKEAYDTSLYDLVLPVQNQSAEALVEAITKHFHTTSVLRTSESQQAIGDMRIEVEVERILLNSGHKMRVRCVNGDITLSVEKSVLNYNKLSQEITALAKRVDGVGEVVVEKSASYNESIYRQQNFELPSKVLFVDDEKEFVQTVSERLISRDVGTYGVYNGEDALELISEDQPDVMVLDLKMPGLHGVEVLRKTKDVAPEVEVIILTGHGTSQDMKQCMELGAFAYMNKPVDIEELSATIKAANEKARSRKNPQ